MQNDIPVYDIGLNYNCRILQALSVFKNDNAFLELLFHNAFESTTEIYNHTVLDKKTRWGFMPAFFSNENLKKIGIHHIEKHFGNFTQGETYIIDLLSKKIKVFLRVDEYYLSNRTDYYMKMHASHSVIVCHYRLHQDNDCYDYLIKDYSPDFFGFIEGNLLKSAFENPCIPSPRAGSIIHYLYTHQVDVDGVIRDFYQWLKEFQDDYYLYDHVKYIITNNEDGIEALRHAFALLTSSRKAFNEFINYFEMDFVTSYLLRSCCVHVEGIFNYLQLNDKNDVDVYFLETECRKLKMLESEIIQKLEGFYLSRTVEDVLVSVHNKLLCK